MRWLDRLRFPMALMSVPCLPLPMCVDSMHMVTNAGFTPLKPPVPLYGPGSIVGVEKRDKYIEVFGICGVRGSLGRGFVTIGGPTQREELSRAAVHRFRVGAQLLRELKTDVTFKHVRSITVAFENPRVMTLQIEDVIANMHNRDPDCARAVAEIMARGDTEVTMVTATLEGDLIYSVAWELGYDVDIETTVPVVTALAAALGVGQAYCTSRSISSKSLIWGIKDDPLLLQLSIKGALNARDLRRAPTRVIPPDIILDLREDPIAPIVPSTDSRNEQYRSSSLDKVTIVP